MLRQGFAGLAVYSGTKFFVEGLSRGMRAELANTGIRITCIQPGDVRTELLSRSTDQEVGCGLVVTQTITIIIGSITIDFYSSQINICPQAHAMLEVVKIG